LHKVICEDLDEYKNLSLSCAIHRKAQPQQKSASLAFVIYTYSIIYILSHGLCHTSRFLSFINKLYYAFSYLVPLLTTMSLYAIKEYRNEVEKIIHYGGTKKETAIRNAFYVLLNKYADSKELKLIPEISLKTKAGKIVTPDGTLKDVLRLDHGYWESKDESDDINEEIKKKFDKGYPNENILFEDSQTAVLIQQGDEVLRVPMVDEEALDQLLNRFISYQRKEVTEFRQAIEHFKEDLPRVAEAIKDIIDRQKDNEAYLKALLAYHEMCKVSINPDITIDDVKEMMLQHILSADIFNTIFDEPHFHQENNIARELNKVVETFFTGTARRETLGRIKHYYDTINAAAAGIADHHEKQKFLKVVYENFYKAYNPKAADRLGIVYTPNEIVQFMIRSTDYLLHKHFGKTLDSKNVEILDPATGTGTFICDIIDYLSKHKLQYKYKNELHANEVAILPYYIANLNIEYVYKQKMGAYAEFENLCFVDTLDNTGFHWVGKQGDLFGVSAENAARIRKQNERKISVIIGNPPYNANQQNENDNNKNREYAAIDKRIKETFIKNSTAQKTKMYDMYSRFFRWAMDRLNENGIIAFITNRSFIESRTFDGFRKTVQEHFDFAYIIDTKSDVRANPKIAGTTHNVFGIQTGVAILLLVKSTVGKIKPHPCRIEYVSMSDEWRKEQKLQWFVEHPIDKIEFESITPDKNNNWVNLSENDSESLIPIASKEVKSGKSKEAIFEIFSLGVATNRDEWVYDFDLNNLKNQMFFFSEFYNALIENNDKTFPTKIKWSRDLRKKLLNRRRIDFENTKIVRALYKPFTHKFFFANKVTCDVFTANHVDFFGATFDRQNPCIGNIGKDTIIPFSVLAFNTINDLNSLSNAAGGNKTFPLYRYTSSGERIDNITDWALELFNNHYVGTEEKREIYRQHWKAIYPDAFEKKFVNENVCEPPEGADIDKLEIFFYVYAVLHHPAYRKKYELNLKREFPRIPLYDNFPQWCKWGEALTALHTNYETVEPYNLTYLFSKYMVEDEAQLANLQKPKLKADKINNKIIIDGFVELHDIPPIAWKYKLGNRSALEWILDQYKEKKPSDPTIAEKFNTYKFADYKDKVIDLLTRVCTVSVETMKIVGQMPKE
jgi:predicted helicase